MDLPSDQCDTTCSSRHIEVSNLYCPRCIRTVYISSSAKVTRGGGSCPDIQLSYSWDILIPQPVDPVQPHPGHSKCCSPTLTQSRNHAGIFSPLLPDCPADSAPSCTFNFLSISLAISSACSSSLFPPSPASFLAFSASASSFSF